MADNPSERLLGVIDSLDELARSCTPAEATEQAGPERVGLVQVELKVDCSKSTRRTRNVEGFAEANIVW